MRRVPAFFFPIFSSVAALAVSTAALPAAETTVDPAPLTVTLTEVEDRKAVFATVETVDVVTARTRISGTIAELTVDEGSLVEAGKPIARVLDPKLKLRLSAVSAKIRSLRAQRKLAQITLNRVGRLRKSGTVSQSKLDEALTALDVVDQELAAASAESKVITQEMSEGEVRAPASGRVMKVFVNRGTVVLPGETVATIAAKAYVLRMYLPERHARFIKVGDQVMVGRRGGEEGKPMRRGRIRQIYPEMNQGRVVADVDVAGLGGFFVGERVPVYVAAGRRAVFIVPESYIFHRYGLAYVKFKDGNEAVVQPGRAVSGGLEILSGLAEGDVLVRPTGKTAGKTQP